MENGNSRVLVKILKIIAAVILIALGLCFTLGIYLYTHVDNVHFIGYTIMPILALTCFSLVWLLLRKKRSYGAQSAEDERSADQPEDGEKS